MDKKKNVIILCLLVLCSFSMVIMIVSLTYKPKNIEFVPPSFESEAIKGMPEPQEELAWSELYQEGMSFKTGICANIIVHKDMAEVYFSNSKDNTVWLKLRVLDENNNILGETGLITPGEYVKEVKLNGNIKEGQKIKLKIMAYEPETYYSEGSIILNTTIKK